MYLLIRRFTAAALALVMVLSLFAVPVAADTEPNDGQSTAEPLARDTTVNGQVSTGDVDVYRFDVAAGEVIEVEGTKSGSETLQLKLYAGGISIQQQVDSAFVASFTGDRGFVGDAASADRTYYLRVAVNDGTGSGSYSVTLRTVPNADPEFNDDAASAVGVATGDTREGTTSTGDVDVYRIDRTAGETVRFQVTSPGSETLNVGLYVDGLAIQQRTDSAFVATFTDRRGVVGDVAGRNATYYLVVSVNDGEGLGNYTVAVDAPPNDDFEPNEDRFAALALFENPFDSDVVVLTEGDEDWLEFRATAGASIEATVSAAGGSLSVALLDDRNPVTSALVLDGGESTLTATAGTTGRYYLQIRPSTATDATIDAEFELTVDGERLGLPNDRFEAATLNDPAGNADPANAPRIRPGTYDDLAIVDDDVDVLGISLERGERVVATARFSHAEDDLTLELLDSGGSVLRTSDSSTDDESIDAVATAAGIHYLRVTGTAGERARYDLEVAVVGGVELVFDPIARDLAPGENATFGIVLSGIEAGLGPSTLTVVSSDPTVLEIAAASMDDVAGDVSVDANGSSVTITVTGNRTGDSVYGIALVETRAGAEGSATLSFAGTRIATTLGSGIEYPLAGNRSSDVTVSTGPSAIGARYGTPSDVDGDGRYEDVNGDGTFNVIDVSVLLSEFDRPGVQDQAQFFDFNGDGTVNIIDVADLLDRT